MEGPCPDPSLWVTLSGSATGAAERARWAPHLASCASCRAELASLATMNVGSASSAPALPPLRRWRWPAAAAAGFLLAVVAALAWRGGGSSRATPEVVAPSSPSAPQVLLGALSQAGCGAFDASVLTEILLGATAEVCLPAGSRGAIEEDGGLRLEAGEAWVETAGDPVRIRAAGLPGPVELLDGAMSVRIGSQSPRAGRAGLFLREAVAGEEAGGEIVVVRGEARLEGGPVLRAGDAHRWGGGAGGVAGGPIDLGRDPRAWRMLAGPQRIREALRDLAREGLPPPFAAEAVLCKKDRSAEAALVFRARGRAWQVPLGAHLPVERGWVRLRLEAGGGRVRVLAGGREILECAEAELEARAYPAAEGASLGILVWGGDVEVREARARGRTP